MPCCSDPADRRGDRERLEKLPTEELLALLDDAVHRAIRAAAIDAVSRLGSERIYGFLLLHYIFISCNAAVLTEAQLERSQSQRAERAGTKTTPNRWSPVDCGHYFYREDLFDEANRLLDPLERRGQEVDVARIFIRAMRHAREEIITDPRIVLSVMDYTEGPGVPFYAYAERFNDAATLARLRSDIGPSPHWDYLDLERSRIPTA